MTGGGRAAIDAADLQSRESEHTRGALRSIGGRTPSRFALGDAGVQRRAEVWQEQQRTAAYHQAAAKQQEERRNAEERDRFDALKRATRSAG